MGKETIFGIKGFSLTEYAISANAILGTRDSGKTYTATKASEEMFDAGIPFIWLDPIGVAHNLRIPGKGRGYPVVVAGGYHGDLPLTVASVGEIVRAAMKSNVSLVVDLFSRDLSKADWRRIVRETCEILLHENSEYGLRHVFIEEAAEFVPQRVVDGQVFSAVEKLVRMGGNSKVGITLINQRSADINKSVLELCANVFVHRQKGKNTLLDLKKWLSLTDPETEKKITASLPDLESGHCWVMSNELKTPLLIKVPEKNSLHPDRRAAHNPDAKPRKPVPADAFVEQMKAALAPKPKQSRAEAERPFREALLAGRSANRQKGMPAVADAETAKVHNRAFGQGQESVRAMIPEMLDAQHRTSFDWGLRLGISRAAGAAGAAKLDGPIPERTMTREIKTLMSQHQPPGMAETQSTGFPKPATRVTAIPNIRGNSLNVANGLDGPTQRIINSILWWNVLHVAEPTQAQVAAMANYSHRSGSWSTYLAACRSQGLVEGKGTLSLTTNGAMLAHEPEIVPTGAGARRAVLARLDGPTVRILTPLIEAYPSSMTQAEVGEAANYSHKSGTWSTYLAKCRSLDLVTGKGELRAAGWLFPEGGE